MLLSTEPSLQSSFVSTSLARNHLLPIVVLNLKLFAQGLSEKEEGSAQGVSEQEVGSAQSLSEQGPSFAVLKSLY